MEQIALNKRKGTIAKIGIGLFVALLLLTFLSKTINGILMPKVTVKEFTKGSLQKKYEADGIFEIQNKHKAIAEGNWKVKKVTAKSNQRVKKGDLLAVIDTTDLKLELKNIQLEILKLENEIENQKQSYEPINISDFKREVQVAKTDLDFAKKKLDATKVLFEAGEETKINLDIAEREYEDKQYVYESKQKLLNEKSAEINKSKYEIDRSIKEKTAELDIKKAELEREKNKIPLNGRILSDCEGVISAVNIEAGISTTINQVMIEIVVESSPYSVTWYVDTEKAVNYGIGHTINVTGKGNSTESSDESIKSYNISLKIDGKELDTDKNQMKFWANISNDHIKKAKIKINEGEKTTVTAVENSGIFKYIIPRNCITEMDGKYYLFIIKEREGALGREKYVQQVETKILADYDFNIAVDGHFSKDDKAVVNTTKPLKDRMQVRVR